MAAPRSQHSQVRGYTRSYGFTNGTGAGSWANPCQPEQGARRGLRQAPRPSLLHPLCVISSRASGREGVLPPCSAWHCHAVLNTPEKVRRGTPSSQGTPCLYLHAPRAILASSCSLFWPERVGNGVGGQRDVAGPGQADPSLAPLPGVSELPSRVSLLCCSWEVLVVLM